MPISIRPVVFWACACVFAGGCDLPGSEGGSDPGGGSMGEGADLGGVEADLLDHINAERMEAGKAALLRDAGLDAVMTSHARFMAENEMLGHTDARGLGGEGRARHFSGDDTVRCSEIIQWWGGQPSGRVHYEGYFASDAHHAAYMEEGALNLGPPTFAGVAAVTGPGPAGSTFEGRAGSYTGVLICDQRIDLEIDPLADE